MRSKFKFLLTRDRLSGCHFHRDPENLDATGKRQRFVPTQRGAPPAALRMLGRDYAADARPVCHERQAVAGADPATFTADASEASSFEANDKSGLWQAGQGAETLK